MTRWIGAVLLTLLTVAPAAAETLAEKAYKATAILYAQTTSGGMDMACTATAFEKVKDGYLFVSAAHCVATSNTSAERVEVSEVPHYISFDAVDNKVFFPAEIVMAGYGAKGDDFAILKVVTDEKWTTMPLGDFSKVDFGEDILNVAAPKGLGRQLFFGRVSLLSMDRPVLANGINWLHATLLQIFAGPGSSGSSIVSLEQEAIIAFLVGNVQGNPSVVAIPVFKFEAFRAAVEAGEYKYFQLPGTSDYCCKED